MPLSFLKQDGVRTDVSEGVHQTNQSQGMRRARLQKKSVRKLNPTEYPASMGLPTSFQAHRRHKSASAIFGPGASSRVEIISSMSSAGIPRPPQLPAEYRNDSKLMSDLPPCSEFPEEKKSLELPLQSLPAERPQSESPLPFDSSSKKSFTRTSGPFRSRTPALRPVASSIEPSSSSRPATSDGNLKHITRMTSAPILTSQRRMGTYNFETLAEEEERRQSSASSIYSACSDDSSATSVSGESIKARQPLAPGEIGKEVSANPFVDTPERPSTSDSYPFPDMSPYSRYLDSSATPKTRSQESLLDWSTGRLPAIPSEPASTRVSKTDSLAEKGPQTPKPMAALGIQATSMTSDPNLLHACQQLEDQLQVVNNRIHARERGVQRPLKVNTEHNGKRRRNSDQSIPSPSYSSSSHSVPLSESAPSSVGTPMTEYSPASVESKFPKPTLQRSSSLLNLLEDVGKDSKSVQHEAMDGDEAVIDSSSATKVIYHILAALPDLSSLFSAALISRGFYQVFKAHELHLIRSIVRKMSPALWKLCELSHAKGNFVTLLDETGTAPRTPASLYLRDYDQAMYTVVALKVMISDRCRGHLRDDQISHFLCEADQERASRLDNAIWRVWTFCATFGCHTGREQDLAAQKLWLGGGATKSWKQRSKKTYGLSRKELEDILQVWSALAALLRSLNLKVSDAKNIGMIEKSMPDQHAQPLMDEWLSYVLSLGPRAVLDLASTWPNTPSAIMKKAKFRGCTDWAPPADGSTMASFLHEAATRLHVESVLSETRDMSFTLPSRAANRISCYADPISTSHKKANSESSPMPSKADLSLPMRSASHASRGPASPRIQPEPAQPLRSRASTSSTQSTDSKVLQWKQTIGNLPLQDEKGGKTKAAADLPRSRTTPPAPQFQQQENLPFGNSTRIVGGPAARNWTLMMAGPESPAVVVPVRTGSLVRSPLEAPIQPHRRMTSATSVTSEGERSKLTPLVEFGEGQFALPYAGTRDIIATQSQRTILENTKNTTSTPTESSRGSKSDGSRTSGETNVSETNVSVATQSQPNVLHSSRRRQTKSTWSMYKSSSSSSNGGEKKKQERRKSSAQFLAHMSQACEGHGLC